MCRPSNERPCTLLSLGHERLARAARSPFFSFSGKHRRSLRSLLSSKKCRKIAFVSSKKCGFSLFLSSKKCNFALKSAEYEAESIGTTTSMESECGAETALSPWCTPGRKDVTHEGVWQGVLRIGCLYQLRCRAFGQGFVHRRL